MSKSLGDKVSGTKADLYDRVTRALSKAGFWGGQPSSEAEETPRTFKKPRQ